MAKTSEAFRKDFETLLKNLQTDQIDIYPFQMLTECRRPGEGTDIYRRIRKAKEK